MCFVRPCPPGCDWYFLKKKSSIGLERVSTDPFMMFSLSSLSAKLELVNRTGKLQHTWQRNNGHFFCCGRHLNVMLGCQGWGKNIIQSLLRIKCNTNFHWKWSLADQEETIQVAKQMDFSILFLKVIKTKKR